MALSTTGAKFSSRLGFRAPRIASATRGNVNPSANSCGKQVQLKQCQAYKQVYLFGGPDNKQGNIISWDSVLGSPYLGKLKYTLNPVPS